jgi:DNA replication and repair protein RecF
MYLKNLHLVHFKNRDQADLEFVDGINCFIGNNGVGKTNLLDSIYYLAFCKSFFNPIDSQNIQYDEGFFVIEGTFDRNEKDEKIYCGFKKGDKKQFKRNKKNYERFSDHIGFLPLVMVSPADTELVYDGSEVRRKFIDGVISQFNSSYLDNLLKYNKAVSQRNALLKKMGEEQRWDASSVEVWNMQLLQHGQPIYEARREFLDEFIPIFQQYYNLIGNESEEVSLVYKSRLHEASFEELLQQSEPKDARAQYTTVGVHKDDLKFEIKGHPLKKFGSQGQQKSFLIALKLAQFDFMKIKKGIKPLLLLDDIFDKLDKNRVKALMSLVSEHHFGQVFVTDANKTRIEELFEDIDTALRIFEVQPNETKLITEK